MSRRIAFIVAMVVLGPACGSRLPDETLTALDRGVVSGETASALDAGAAEIDGSSPRSEGATANTGVASSGGQGSASASPTGSGAGAEAGTDEANSKCADLPVNAPGITDDEIKVASIVTDSGPLPGATEASYRAAGAQVAMVNAQGGVCGRKLTLLKGDDGLDPAKARAEFLRLEPQVFAFVGSYAVADSGYIDLIADRGVPYVGSTVEPEGRGPRNVMPKTAETTINTGPYAWWAAQYPNIKKTAIVWADVGGVSVNVKGAIEGIKRAGFEVLWDAAADVVTPDYTAEVRKAQDDGAEFLYLYAFEVSMHVRFVRAMRQQNYDPPIKGSNIAFTTRFSELLGTDGDGWQNHTPHLLFLDPGERARSQDLDNFLTWNERLFPGGSLDLFAVNGWGRAAYFVDAMRLIEGELSREALTDALWKVKEYDYGGIGVALNPTNGESVPCFAMAEHVDGKWVRLAPMDREYECSLGEMYKFR